MLTVSSGKFSLPPMASDTARPLADEFSARSLERPCTFAKFGPILIESSQFVQFLIGTSGRELQHFKSKLTSHLGGPVRHYSLLTRCSCRLWFCSAVRFHRLQMLADHRGDPDAARPAQGLTQKLITNALELIMPRVLILARITSWHAAERGLRFLQPLTNQNALEIPRSFIDLFGAVLLVLQNALRLRALSSG